MVSHLYIGVIPNFSGQLAELIVFYDSTRIDLYSHQILLLELSQAINTHDICIYESNELPLYYTFKCTWQIVHPIVEQ